MTDRELMQMALTGLERISAIDRCFSQRESIRRLRDRLAQPEMIPITNGGVATLMPSSEFFGGQPEPEPVAWLWHEVKWENGERQSVVKLSETKDFQYAKPLYTAPPKREWVGLTDEEAWECWDWEDFQGTWKSMESKLKEKNT